MMTGIVLPCDDHHGRGVSTLACGNDNHLGQGRADEHAQQAGPNTRTVRQMTTVRPSCSIGTGRLGDAGTHRIHGCHDPVNLITLT